MNPVLHVKRPGYFESKQAELNTVLVFEGIRLNDEGKLEKCKRARTIADAQQAADKLRQKLTERGVHPDALFILHGHYFIHIFVNIFLIQRQIVDKGLHRGAPLAVTSLICPVIVVPGHKYIQIGLDLFYGSIQLSAKSHLVKFLLDCLVETFNGAVGLRMPDLDPRVLDIVEMEKELIGVALGTTAVFRAVVA